MRGPWLVLITGLPGSGKSTFAEDCAPTLGASVIGHDWTMAGLAPFHSITTVLEDMDRMTRRTVGWSLMGSLARAQLRAGRSIVLDGVARDPEVATIRQVAVEEAARSLIVLLGEPDEDTHRQRIEGRRRSIPNWSELSWPEVARSRARWPQESPTDVDLEIGSTNTRQHNIAAFERLHRGPDPASPSRRREPPP